MKKFLKILLLTFLILLSSFAIVIVIINSTKFFIYKDYFGLAKELTVNEGLGDGYVPQGVAKIQVKNDDVYISCGYMTKNRPSRLYVVKPQNTYYVEVLINDFDLSKEHFGGISANKDYLFIACEGKIYSLRIKDVLDAEYTELVDPEQNDVKIINTFTTDIAASYVYVDEKDDSLYVGEFNGNGYDTGKDILVNNGTETYHSYIEKFRVLDVVNKNKANSLITYVVRDLVQGFAVSEDKIVLSTSYGLASSYFYSYNIPIDFDDKNTKTYYLDDRYLDKTIKAPAMAGGLDYDGKYFITLYESASNKYFFGKFFFANKIIGFEL